jgi:hypothetical protein
MPVDQPEIPRHLMNNIEHGTFERPSDENWEFCRAMWMKQLSEAKKWIDITYRNYVAKKPPTNNDQLVISNCEHLLASFEKAKQQGFMELGWMDQYEQQE